jgi:hypothetical protein
MAAHNEIHVISKYCDSVRFYTPYSLRYSDCLRDGRLRGRVRVTIGSRMLTSIYPRDQQWAHPASSYSMGIAGSFPEVKRPGRREADQSPLQPVPRSRNMDPLPLTSSWRSG